MNFFTIIVSSHRHQTEKKDRGRQVYKIGDKSFNKQLNIYRILDIYLYQYWGR